MGNSGWILPKQKRDFGNLDALAGPGWVGGEGGGEEGGKFGGT
jgi:hypothetical protein